MPRIPFGFGDVQLPPTGGIRGGTVGIPAVQEPGLDLGTATLPARGVAALGQQVEKAGQSVLQAEGYAAQAKEYVFQAAEYKAHRERAQDVLDSNMGLHALVQEYQPAAAERAKGDYRTLPEDVVKIGKSLADKVALERNLSAGAKALFREKAEALIDKAQGDALDVQNKKFQQDTTFAMSTAVHQAQQEALRAKDETDLQVAMDRLHSTLAEGVPAGLWKGEVAAKMYRDTEATVQNDWVKRAILTHPDAMKAQLFAQLQGEPTNPALPVAQPDSLVELYQQAEKVSLYHFQRREHDERYADYVRGKEQTKNSGDLRAKIYTTSLIPENVATFQNIIREAEALQKTGALDEATTEHIMRTAQAHALQAGRIDLTPRDDQATEQTLALAVRLAERPEQFAQAREMITTSLGRITTETRDKLYDKLEQREKVATDWHAYPEVQNAKNIIMRGAMVPYGGTLAGQMKPLMQQKLTWAVDRWEATLEELYADPKAGPAQVKAHAKELAWEARRDHLQPDINNKADAQEYLPPDVQNARDQMELAQAIHALRLQGWSGASLLIIRDNWNRWQEAQREEAQRLEAKQASGTKKPGVTGMPSSYQLPSLQSPESRKGN